MARLTFYPLGNADCCRIDLDSDKKVLFDYADTRDPEDEEDLRIDLPSKLKEDLQQAKRDYYDAVAFTHLDNDHFKGATEFFYLEHAKKYQTEGRIKIKTMWVPAAMITEVGVKDAEGRVLQAEARHRFKEGKGIRVFSRPEKLTKWLEDNGLALKDRQHLITNAGQLAPEITTGADGSEFFVHSPFAKRLEDGTVEDRNAESLVMHATFLCKGVKTKVLLLSDCTHEPLSDIVEITKAKNNQARLDWDVCKIPHHCSYLSLGPEKGEDKTVPVESVKALYEEHGEESSIMVSPSEPIPEKGSEADKQDDPPHRQAANYYKERQEPARRRVHRDNGAPQGLGARTRGHRH